MRTYVVVTETYERYGCNGELKLDLFHAKDLNDLAEKLAPDLFKVEDDEPVCTKDERWEYLCGAMGDGMDNYVVKELQLLSAKNQRLVEVEYI